MLVNRLHTKLFEAAAWDLDRQIRAKFVDESLRADYLKDFEGRLSAVSQTIDAGVEPSGRFLGLKRTFKRLFRPYLVQQNRVDRMLIDRLSELHREVSRLAFALEESRNELRDDSARQSESIRAELIRESRRTAPKYGESPRSTVSVGHASRSLEKGAKLVLGQLPVRREGYIHVDPSSSSDADISAPLDDLPVDKGTAAELLVANVLELYPVTEVTARLLPYWASLLQPGGRLTVIADDAGAMADRFRDGQLDFSELTAHLFGHGDFVRRSAYTPEMLRAFVSEAGFSDVSVTDRRQRPDLGAYGFELAAVRVVA